MITMNLRISILFLFVGLTVFDGGCGRTGGNQTETQRPSFSVDAKVPLGHEKQPEQSTLEEDWGIKIESARLSAGGYMIDFRFRVLDAEKAAQIFDRKIMPQMIDQATGARFIVPSPPKVGQLRSGGNIKEDRIYFM